NVTAVLDFTPPNSDTARQWWSFRHLPDKGKVPYNVPPEGSQTQELIVLNRSAAEIAPSSGQTKRSEVCATCCHTLEYQVEQAERHDNDEQDH
ncbi:MAG: hypothetical protein R6W74_09320, partial [Nitrosomonas halophila]